jgi:hypothetical protein
LSSVTVLDLSGKELGRIESDVLAAATQTLLTQTQGASIPASAAESVDVDLALPAGTAPDRVTHRIVYAIEPNAPLASIVGTFSINGPEVEVNRTPANDPTAIDGERMVGGQWLRRSQYSSRHPHCHRRFADRDAGNIRNRLDSAERRKTFEGDGARNEDHYAFGADLLAVADGTLRKTYGADFAEGYRSEPSSGLCWIARASPRSASS